MFKFCCEDCGECWYVGNPRTCKCPNEELQQPKQEQVKPVAWGMEKDGVILDVICPAEHEREEGSYTVPLYTTPQLETKDEPVAWMYWQSCLNDDGTQTSPWVQRYSKFKPTESVINKDITPLYTTPQRTWVGLKDDDEIPWDGVDAKSFAKAIEAKLKEKNT